MGHSGVPFFLYIPRKTPLADRVNPARHYADWYMADNSFEIDGFVAQREELERLLTTDPKMEKRLQKIIRKVLMEVRKEVSESAKTVLKSDPRQAYKAVKTAVYRQILGGSVSILSKRRKSTQFSAYEPVRKLQPKQRGGNRRVRSKRTWDIQHYAGPDRAFILRFVNGGTLGRAVDFNYDENRRADKWNKHPNTGFRGRIAPRNFFGNVSHRAMRGASAHLQQLIDQLIREEFNK